MTEKRVQGRVKATLFLASREKMLENQRRDVARKCKRVHLMQRYEQRVIDLELHYPKKVFEEVYLAQQRLAPFAKREPTTYPKPVKQTYYLVSVRKRRWRVAPKVVMAYRLNQRLKMPKEL